MDKKEMLKLRLDGYTYQHIAKEAGVTRQRVQQIISPPRSIRIFVVNKYEGKCNRCGIFVGQSGHVHHNGDLDMENYNDPTSLELLCLACHREAHLPMLLKAEVISNPIKALRKKLGLTQEAFARQLNVSVQTIRRWESDKGTHPSRMAKRLIKELFQVEIK